MAFNFDVNPFVVYLHALVNVRCLYKGRSAYFSMAFVKTKKTMKI